VANIRDSWLVPLPRVVRRPWQR